MSQESEIARIQAAYRGYSERGFVEGKWSRQQPGNQAIEAERAKKLKELLTPRLGSSATGKRLLDLGCGSGEVLQLFADLGFDPGNLYGVDLLPDRITQARKQFPSFQFQQANGAALPFADGFFDFVVCFTIFSSILDRSLAAEVAREAARVLRPGGTVICYDFCWNNPANSQVRGIGLRELRRLFPGFSCLSERLTLVPPLARRLGRFTGAAYPLLAALPFLQTHVLALLAKPDHGR